MFTRDERLTLLMCIDDAQGLIALLNLPELISAEAHTHFNQRLDVMRSARRKLMEMTDDDPTFAHQAGPETAPVSEAGMARV